MRKLTTLTLAAIVAATFTSAAVAQERTDRVIRYRQAIFRAMNFDFGILNGVVKGERPFDKDVVARNTMYVDQLAHMPWDAFGPGTDKGAPTKASPDIWKDTARFKQLAADLQTATGKLAMAGKSGDAAQLKTAFNAVSDACEACHDPFRQE